MATVIRSARLAGTPFLLVRGPREADTAEAVSELASPAARPELEIALPPQPEAAPSPPEAVEPARTPEPVRAVKSALSLSDRDRLVREEFEALREQVLERARQEGFEEGVVSGQAAFTDQIEALRRVVASAGEALRGEIQGVEDVVIDIAFEAVCRIMGAVLVTPEGVASVVREVIRDVREREQLLVRLSPQDFALLGEQADVLLKGQEGLRLEFLPDERVVLGGCIVEVAGGTLDGRLETQLKQLSDTLLGARRVEGEGGA